MRWNHHCGGHLKNKRMNYKKKINCSIDIKDLLYLYIINTYQEITLVYNNFYLLLTFDP